MVWSFAGFCLHIHRTEQKTVLMSGKLKPLGRHQPLIFTAVHSQRSYECAVSVPLIYVSVL